MTLEESLLILACLFGPVLILGPLLWWMNRDAVRRIVRSGKEKEGT